MCGLGGLSGAENFLKEQLHLVPGALSDNGVIADSFQMEFIRFRIHEGMQRTGISKELKINFPLIKRLDEREPLIQVDMGVKLPL
jgi:hypothetical protein